MSVNGSAVDRKTSKPISDSTSWTVKTPAGATVLDSKGKPLSGLNAADAFSAARGHLNRTGEYVVPVRS